MKIHPTAEVSENARIGQNTSIWNNAQVREGSEIGSNCVISKDVYIDCDVKIGYNVKIQNGVSVYKGVTIEDGVFLGPRMTFTNDLYPRAHIWNDDKIGYTVVRKGASIGAGSVIICGDKKPREIGEYALIAAGSVVTKDVPAHGFVVGVPARLKGFVCECANRLKEDKTSDPVVLVCGSCGKRINIPKDILRMIE